MIFFPSAHIGRKENENIYGLPRLHSGQQQINILLLVATEGATL